MEHLTWSALLLEQHRVSFSVLQLQDSLLVWVGVGDAMPNLLAAAPTKLSGTPALTELFGETESSQTFTRRLGAPCLSPLQLLAVASLRSRSR